MCLKTSPSFSIPLQSSHWGYGGHRDDHDDDRDDHRDNHGNEDFPPSFFRSLHWFPPPLRSWQYGNMAYAYAYGIWHMTIWQRWRLRLIGLSSGRGGTGRTQRGKACCRWKKLFFFLKMFKKWLQALSSNIFKKDLTMFSSQNIVIKFLCRWHFWQLWC